MKTRMLTLFTVAALFAVIDSVFGQGSAFTYQGRLNDTGQPANGNYDLTFALFNVSSNGNALAGPIANNAVPVSNGLFTVTLDFGANVFNGDARWLQVGVRTNGTGAFATLLPRQQVLPVPYALYAMTPAGPAGPTGPQGPQGPQGAGLPSGGIIMWSGTSANIPSGWVLCDGANGTPDLRDRFIVGAGSQYNAGATGGNATHSHGGTTGASSQTVGGASPYLPSASAPNHTHPINSDSNVPPYYALCFIMKQ